MDYKSKAEIQIDIDWYTNAIDNFNRSGFHRTATELSIEKQKLIAKLNNFNGRIHRERRRSERIKP